MYAQTRPAPARRRGVVLVLILAMLSLLALIGFSFASLTGQAQAGGRKYAEAALTPTSDQVMDFALAQLINDTTGPTSPLYGHSLKRDMYGNDAFSNGGPLAGTSLAATGSTATVNGVSYPTYTATTPTASGVNLTRWIIRVDATNTSVAQTLEVQQDVVSGTGHTMALSFPDTTTHLYNYGSPLGGTVGNVLLSQPGTVTTFVADGRFLRAFNGEGLAAWGSVVNGVTTQAQLGNFRLTGVDPNNVGMDEDYDAADLENWFLALQSADGSVMIPSFHRPGIVDASDWTTGATAVPAHILRPRQIDGHDAATFPDLTPGTGPNNTILYDVDNDGDGLRDSVWLDLGFPAQRDATGKLYKPMFSLMVLGTNGRLPLNTAGNLQGRLLANAPTDYSLYPIITPQAGDPTYNHTSHLGASPNEINPLYALQNAPDTLDTTNYSGDAFSSQFDNALRAGTSAAPGNPAYNVGVPVSVTQLRNLLTGTRIPTTAGGSFSNNDSNTVQVNVNGTPQPFVMGNNVLDQADLGAVRGTPTVEGRWGEGGLIPQSVGNPAFPRLYFTNIVRAGRSNALKFTYPGVVRQDWDSADDDFDTFDFFPLAGPETGEFFDPAGANLLPSERIRRFVKPIDPVGTGRMLDWGNSFGIINQYTYGQSVGTQSGFGQGFDSRGRAATWGYFRPPGLATTQDYSTSGYSPFLSGTAPIANAATSGPDLLSNLWHGYESERNPAGTNYFYQQAAMPYTSGVGNAVPTFADASGNITPINSEDANSTPVVNYGYLLGSLNQDEADEMNLYAPSKLDSPFGPEDLEWLYREHDVDGASLDSRLASLAPISFVNSPDAVTRRRMFSVDSWETTNFVYAHDNPGNAFPYNHRTFTAGSPAYVAGNPEPYLGNGASLYVQGVPTPSLAHRDRKINLNFPLPVSNDPNEPVRRKWISDSYQLLLHVLPPEAVDTPEERVQLCQYLVNVIDFRDPDGAITQFTMSDVQITTAAPQTYPTAVFSGGNPLTLYGMEYCPIAFSEVLAYSFRRNKGGNPTDTPRLFIELTNTLTQANTPANTPTYAPAGWNPSDVDLTGWDLVLAAEDPAAAGAGNGDNCTSRPAPLTGQIPDQPAANPAKLIYMPLSPRAAGANHYFVPSLTNAVPTPIPHYVLSNYLQDPTSENAVNNTTTPGLDTPNVAYDATNNANGVLRGVLTRTGLAAANVAAGTYLDADDPLAPGGTTFTTTSYHVTGTGNLPPAATNTNTATLTTAAPILASGQAKYLWLYLRRPANPLALADQNNPMIVVDSIRFPFIEGGGVAGSPPSRPAATIRDIYSVQRPQPFRGGHAVPTTPATAAPSPPSPYGFSEQIAIAAVQSARVAAASPPTQAFLYGVYNDSANSKYYQITGKGGASPPGVLTQTASTVAGQSIDYYVYPTPPPPAPPTATYYGDANAIAHTLGRSPAGGTRDNFWDHLAFHDRDFMSVAELLLVPGCPPGLFTKQFVEFQPVAGGLTSGGSDPSGGKFAVPPGAAGAALPTSATTFATVPQTYPYLPDNFYYTGYSGAAADTPAVVNGATGAGWHKMFGFFEVPSSANGAIGPVSSGQNFDWARQDLRPGLLNLNLIIDEEVFFGLIDDPLRMNLFPATVASSISATASLPQIQTGTTGGGTTPVGYTMNNRGFTYWVDQTQTVLTPPGNPFPKFSFNPTNTPVDSVKFPASGTPTFQMKAAFSDFLKLRHGGTGVLFGNGVERPFHDVTYPDINFTVMRPAAVPPAGAATTPASNPRDPGLKTADPNFGAPPNAVTTTQGPPPIPARRLIGIPDNTGSSAVGATPSSNASLYGDTTFNNLTPPIPDLSAGIGGAFGTNVYLGGNSIAANPTATPPTPAVNDLREHPVYRTEWLQKVMNLTTVRTHQYAVWVTVGFFEVNAQGSPLASPPVPDTIGRELGAADGHNVRYRSFFTVDRTRAVGYNPQDPGDFRDLITYRRRIE